VVASAVVARSNTVAATITASVSDDAFDADIDAKHPRYTRGACSKAESSEMEYLWQIKVEEREAHSHQQRGDLAAAPASISAAPATSASSSARVPNKPEETRRFESFEKGKRSRWSKATGQYARRR
jgi:hypothetical protein